MTCVAFKRTLLSIRTMRRHLRSVVPMPVQKLHILSALAIALTGCGSSPSLNVLAYNACIARHLQEAAVCEGPRQAYELDPTVFQARAPAISLPDRSSREVRQ